MSNSDRLLMIFARNPELAKVKTRLAKDVGAENALKVYNHLLDHTLAEANKVFADKAIFMADRVQDLEIIEKYKIPQFLQKGEDLGERMEKAFNQAFEQKYETIVLISSDCNEITSQIIEQAFSELDTHECVIGPARDGGYYLIGLRGFYPELFQNKVWGKENVFLDTLLDIQQLQMSYSLLPTLKDVDTVHDLGELVALIDPGLIDNKKNE